MSWINLNWIISLCIYLILGPIIGGLLVGLERIISAKMQRRIGPPILQPFYDVLKLFGKQKTMVDKTQNFYVFCFLLFAEISGALFFVGCDLLLVFFTLTLANIFLVLAAYAASSPFSFIGAERELIQMIAYEPMMILNIVGFYIVTKSFYVKDIVFFNQPIIFLLPGCFIGLIAILCIKFGKSPYDLSSSHHPHQEIVKGVTTDFSGKVLAMIEIAHWYEYLFLLGFVYLFFSFNIYIGIAAVIFVYLLQIFIDNVFARFKYKLVLKSMWVFTLVIGFGNILIVYILFYFSNILKNIF